MKISTILDHIDNGHVALPVFQRGYVWNRDQVRGLMQSLYRGHPVGSLLVWVTESEKAEYRGDETLAPGVVKLLLDGQQRMTTLYGLSRGQPPKFFEGNAQSFTGLRFHLGREEFEFYSPIKMKDDPLWIDVTGLLKSGLGPYLPLLASQGDVTQYVNRLNNILQIPAKELHVEEVTGADKTVEVVVDIFNRVNSGGTKLSQGDLALAKVCAAWPEARDEMQKLLNRYAKVGFNFDLDWFLRNINTVLTGEARFVALHHVGADAFRDGMKKTESALGTLLDLVGGRLGLDHDRVLFGRYAFPVLARYLTLRGGKLADAREQGMLLYWYLQSAMWGRFSGATESAINQDIRAFERDDAGVDGLLRDMSVWRGDPTIRPEDFGGWGVGARSYPMLYLLTRVGASRDFGTGLPLKAGLLGRNSSLQIHHLFPRARLYKARYRKDQANAIANFCFLTQSSNLDISDRLPEDYFEEVEKRFPGSLASQWIPMDRSLWRMDRYLDFLAARRELIARTANDFLVQLRDGELPRQETASLLETTAVSVSPLPGGIESSEEETLLGECNEWVVSQGLPSGQLMYELSDEESNRPLAVLDLAWPEGLQPGFSEPIALLLDEGQDTLVAANRAGYRYFTLVEDLQEYVLSTIMGQEVESPDANRKVTRASWVERRSETIIAAVDRLVELVGEVTCKKFTPGYNVGHIALLEGDKPRAFIHFGPRTQHIRMLTEVADKAEWKERLERCGIEGVSSSRRWLRFNIDVEDVTSKREILSEIIAQAYADTNRKRGE
jgi:hypothetical protein